MLLGPSHPVWWNLYLSLASLAAECGGSFAFVIDHGNGLWCVGAANHGPHTRTPHADRVADRFYLNEMIPRLATLRRGRPLDVVKVEGNDRYVATSFAGIYAVVVCFEQAFEPAFAQACVRRVLPRIEALTIALPPSPGPGYDEGAAKVRAA
jgi:hypothetical protein